jgi:hypothetical protein
MATMTWRARFKLLEHKPWARRSLFVLGIFCVMLAPLLGPLPGPGGIPLFLLGMTLMLRYSKWAKRNYVRLKRRWPKQGNLVDRGLRRVSAKRRANRSND